MQFQRLSISLHLILLGALVFPSCAQEDEWKQLISRAQQFLGQDNYSEAITSTQEALRVAESTYGPDHANVLKSLYMLAVLYDHQHKYTEAEPLYRRALAIQERVLGPDHPEVTMTLLPLADLYKAEGHYEEAEPLYKRLVAILERTVGPMDPLVAKASSSLAAVYEAQKLYGEAEALRKRSVDILEKAPGEPLEVATALDNLANLDRNLARNREAEPLYKQSLAIRQKTLGQEHLGVVISLNNLAMLCEDQGRYGEAESLYKQSLSIVEKALGPNDPTVAALLNRMAELYVEEKLDGQAEPLYQRSADILENAPGTKPLDAAKPLRELAGLYRKQGRYSEAELPYKRVLAILEKALGAESLEVANALDDLAGIYFAQGQYGEAEPLLKRTLGIRQKALPPEHSDLGQALFHLASIDQEEGRYGEAETLYKQSVDILEKALGAEPLKLAAVLDGLGNLYRAQGRYDEAEPLFGRALAIHEKAQGPQDPAITTLLNNMASLYQQEGQYGEAEQFYTRALSILEKERGPDHPKLVRTLNNLAALYQVEQRYELAEHFYTRALAILERAHWPGNPDLSTTLINVANLDEMKGLTSQAATFFDRGFAAQSQQFDYYFTYMSEKERLQFLSTVAVDFPAYFSFCYTHYVKHPRLVGRMYDLVLWEKGMVVSSIAADRASMVANGDSQALAVLDRLTSTKNQLAALVRLEPTNEQRWLNAFDKLNSEANDLESALTRRSARFAAERKLKRPSWQHVRSSLKEDEAAVEFVRFRFHDSKKGWSDKDYYIALLLTPRVKRKQPTSVKGMVVSEMPELVFLGEAKDLEAGPMEDYRRLVLMKGLSASESGLAFYRAFWKPLESKLIGVKRVYVSPDGVLNQVSWAAVPTDDGRLLSDKYEVDLVLSTKDLLRERHDTAKLSAVLVGDPQFDLSEKEHRAAVADLQAKAGSESSCAELDKPTASSEQPQEGDSKNVVVHALATSDSTVEGGTRLESLTDTQKEIKSLSDVFKNKGWQVESYCHQNALEEVIKRVKSPRVLHVATHGFFRPDQRWAIREGPDSQLSGLEDPMLRSGLYFAGADRTLSGEGPIEGVESGVLTAYEATGLNLQGTELVVLSACETGLGLVENGEGVFGLRRALQEAGAEAVLMSMWPVPDRETEELMTLFYEKWLSGMDKHKALHEAQMELRKELQDKWRVDHPPPHFWAAFALVGH